MGTEVRWLLKEKAGEENRLFFTVFIPVHELRYQPLKVRTKLSER